MLLRARFQVLGVFEPLLVSGNRVTKRHFPPRRRLNDFGSVIFPFKKFVHRLAFSIQDGINPHSLSSTAGFGLLDLTNEIAGPFHLRGIALGRIAKHT